MQEFDNKILLEHTDEKIILEVLSGIIGFNFKDLSENHMLDIVLYFYDNFDIHLLKGDVFLYPFDDEHLYFQQGLCYFYWGDILAGSFYKNDKDDKPTFNLTNINIMRNDITKEVTDILHRIGYIKAELNDDEFIKNVYNDFILNHPDQSLSELDVDQIINFNVGKWSY